MKGHFPARTHKPVDITVQSFALNPGFAARAGSALQSFHLFSKGVLKRIFSFLMWDHFFNLACNSMGLCHQGSFSMRGFFLCCSLCMVQGLPAKLNPPRQFAQTEVHSRNRGGKEALLGAENAAVVVLSLCLSPWLKTTRF